MSAVVKNNTPIVSFLGIGAQKSGTTWLYKNLKRHPEIWLPAVKELHYFSRDPKYPSPSRLSIPGRYSRFSGSGVASLESRKRLWNRFIKFKKTRDFSQLLEELKYELGYYDDSWYFSLFRGAKGGVAGEITPAYALLDHNDILQIDQLLSSPKIIFIMRDPIDRSWSQLRRIKGNRKVETTVDFMLEVIEGEHHSLRSDYIRTLDNWSKVIPQDRFFVCFYEEIRDRPGELLTRLFKFLGVRSDVELLTSDKIRDKVNEGKISAPIPAEIEHYLAKRYLPMLEELAARYGSYPSAWLARAQAVLSSESSARVSSSNF